MFDINPSPDFTALVKVNVATPSGIWREETFTAQFKRTDEDQREELLALKNTELLRRVLIGWTMVDLKRNPVPFNEETLERFLLQTGAVRETMLVYWNHNVGAKQKN